MCMISLHNEHNIIVSHNTCIMYSTYTSNSKDGGATDGVAKKRLIDTTHSHLATPSLSDPSRSNCSSGDASCSITSGIVVATVTEVLTICLRQQSGSERCGQMNVD